MKAPSAITILNTLGIHLKGFSVMQRSSRSLLLFGFVCLLLIQPVLAEEDPSLDFVGFLELVKSGRDLEVRTCLAGTPGLLQEHDVEYGATALHWAAAKGMLPMATLLLEYGANPCAMNNEGQTPSEVAKLSNYPEMIIPLRCATIPLESLLFQAVKDGGLPTIVQILDLQPAIINTVDDLGATPLHWAAYRGFAAIVAYLLDNGADATTRNNAGNRPVEEAKNQQSVWALLNRPSESSQNVWLASMYSPRLGVGMAHQEISEQIRKQALKQDIDGRYEDVIKILELPEWQRSPIRKAFLAAHEGDMAMLRRLIRSNPELVRAVDPATGGTLLHAAAADGPPEAVSFLLLQGAEPEAQDSNGNTPQQIALRAGRAVVAEMIETSAGQNR